MGLKRADKMGPDFRFAQKKVKKAKKKSVQILDLQSKSAWVRSGKVRLPGLRSHSTTQRRNSEQYGGPYIMLLQSLHCHLWNPISTNFSVQVLLENPCFSNFSVGVLWEDPLFTHFLPIYHHLFTIFYVLFAFFVFFCMFPIFQPLLELPQSTSKKSKSTPCVVLCSTQEGTARGADDEDRQCRLWNQTSTKYKPLFFRFEIWCQIPRNQKHVFPFWNLISKFRQIKTRAAEARSINRLIMRVTSHNFRGTILRGTNARPRPAPADPGWPKVRPFAAVVLVKKQVSRLQVPVPNGDV